MTQGAADVLNVSQQYLVRLLDDGRLPFHETGGHRRIWMEDTLVYKRQRERERIASLDGLPQLSQEYGGYDELFGTEG